jgi:hypothetical protein
MPHSKPEIFSRFQGGLPEVVIMNNNKPSFRSAHLMQFLEGQLNIIDMTYRLNHDDIVKLFI